MAIRLDPRRLSLLKQISGEAGMRPGELVTHWIEERLDAERSGAPSRASIGADAIASLAGRLDELARRVDELSAAAAPQPAPRRATAARRAAQPGTRRRRGPATASAASNGAGRRIPLHEEIASVIAESGPMSAAQIAEAIVSRGRYSPPRSDRPLDAATVNSRVSNPTYRSRFRREDGKIGLAPES